MSLFQTFSTLELVKKDLSDFGDAVATEATAIANNTVESVKQQAQTLQHIVTPVFAEQTEETKRPEVSWLVGEIQGLV